MLDMGFMYELEDIIGTITKNLEKIDRKIDVLKKYRFCICYENIKDVSGYVTEKIFDAFWAGCIPVYLGADNISDHVPKNCFISRRDFGSDEESPSSRE